jgi:hypothetical protein
MKITEELKNEIVVIRRKTDDMIKNLIIEHAKLFQYEIGDVIEDHQNFGVIESIRYSVSTFSLEFDIIYTCSKKNLLPFKDTEKCVIYHSNILRITKNGVIYTVILKK